MEKTNNNRSLDFRKVDINGLQTIEQITEIGKQILKSGLCPKHIETESDVLVTVLYGKELGFKLMQSLNDIFPINGKPSLGIHVKTALLLKAGVYFKVLEDYSPLYRYKDKSGTVYSKIEIETGNFQIVNSKTPKGAIISDKVQVIEELYDRITKIEFKRKLKQPDNSWIELHHIESFYYSTAIKAGLITKDSWKNYPSKMCFSRCLGYGGAIVADDILKGIYTTEEMLDTEQINYNLTEEGKVIIIDDNIKNEQNNN